MKYADLQIHTTLSDGEDTPKKAIEKAKKAGIHAISITDHDTVGAFKDIEIFNQREIEIIPGVELSCYYEKEEVHVLGYFIDYLNEGLTQKLRFYQGERVKRIQKIIEKLREYNISLKFKDIAQFSKGESIGRMHVAKALVKKGYASSLKDAFDRFLGNNGVAYIPKSKLSIEAAIQLIKEFKGIPVLAHPGIYQSKEEILMYSIKKGIEGIEVQYPEHSKIEADYLYEFAIKHKLIPTGGSDHHGDERASLGSIKIPYRYVEMLKERR